MGFTGISQLRNWLHGFASARCSQGWDAPPSLHSPDCSPVRREAADNHRVTRLLCNSKHSMCFQCKKVGTTTSRNARERKQLRGTCLTTESRELLGQGKGPPIALCFLINPIRAFFTKLLSSCRHSCTTPILANLLFCLLQDPFFLHSPTPPPQSKCLLSLSESQSSNVIRRWIAYAQNTARTVLYSPPSSTPAQKLWRSPHSLLRTSK